MSVLPEKIQIIDIYPQILGEISLEDVQKEGFIDKNEFIDTWREIYGDYDPSEYIWVVEFQYLGNTDTFKENLNAS